MNTRFEDFVGGITACYKYIRQIKSAETGELGLRGTHIMCLYYLGRSEKALTAAELCRLCCEDKAAISRTAAELREKGFIERGEKRYRSGLKLSAAGRELAGKLEAIVIGWTEAGGEGISEADREVFYRVLGTIGKNLEAAIESRKS